MTAWLLYHVQNFVAITSLEIRWKQKQNQYASAYVKMPPINYDVYVCSVLLISCGLASLVPGLTYVA